MYNQYKKVRKIPEEVYPFYASVNYLKKKGIIGYNPNEKVGNRYYTGTDEEGVFTKDRAQRYEEVRSTLLNEEDFNNTYNKIVKEVYPKKDWDLYILDKNKKKKESPPESPPPSYIQGVTPPRIKKIPEIGAELPNATSITPKLRTETALKKASQSK